MHDPLDDWDLGTHQRRHLVHQSPHAATGSPTVERMDCGIVYRLPEVLLPMSRLIRSAVRADPPLPLIPYAQVEVLRVVQEQPGVSVGGVADALQLAPNTVSTLVKAMTTAGVLQQEPVAGKGRTTTLFLTEKAEATIEVWDRKRAELIGDVLASMPEESVAAIIDALPALAQFQAELERRIASLRR